MDKQEIFDKVVTHLRTQKGRAFNDDNGQCRYRMNGMSCAVGCLIPDEEYSPSLEGRTLNKMMTEFVVPPTIQKMIDDGHQTLLSRFQNIHDSGEYNAEYWENAFKVLANDFKLEFKAP